MLHPHPAAKSLATEIGLLALRTFLKRAAEGTPMPWQGYYPSLVQSHVRDSLHWLRHLVAGIHRIDAKKLRPIVLGVRLGAQGGAGSEEGRQASEEGLCCPQSSLASDICCCKAVAVALQSVLKDN